MNKTKTLKELAKNAKNRLTNSNYENKKNLKNFKYINNIKDFSFDIEIKKLDSTFENNLKNKVEECLLEDYDSITPLNKLIDYEYFNSLNDIQKQKYILDLSEFYIKTKMQFDKQKIMNA